MRALFELDEKQIFLLAFPTGLENLIPKFLNILSKRFKGMLKYTAFAKTAQVVVFEEQCNMRNTVKSYVILNFIQLW